MPVSAVMEMCPWRPAELLTSKTKPHITLPNYNIFHTNISTDAQNATPPRSQHVISIEVNKSRLTTRMNAQEESSMSPIKQMEQVMFNKTESWDSCTKT